MTKTQKRRLIKYIVVLIIAVACIIAEKLDKSNITSSVSRDGEYNYVHFLDVGQGDCTLIETSDKKFGLIDTSTQSACDKILVYLQDMGIEELEFVLFTHPHEDHIGCGDEVVENFDVKTVYMTDKIENTAAFKRLISATNESKKEIGTRVLHPQKGDIFTLSDIDFTALSDVIPFEDLNNSSICIKMELGKSTFIFTGDAEKKVESYILESGENIRAEVFKCAHHGSSTSNSEDFLDAVNPDIAVISCGLDNDYGHPHDEVIKELEERDIIYKRTDLDGDVVIAFDEDTIGIL